MNIAEKILIEQKFNLVVDSFDGSKIKEQMLVARAIQDFRDIINKL